MKIAIDGPSASGKGTISKKLAKILSLEYLNTGKIYRIIAFLASKKAGNLHENAIEIAKNIEKYYLQEAKNEEIYTEENAKITSEIAKISDLRKLLVEFQRNFAKKGNVILEGRDIGTVILPDANFKFYLDASAEERAKRRFLQLKENGKNASLEQILEDIKSRDENDKNRKEAALKMAEDGHYIDTTSKNIEEVLTEIISFIDSKKA